MKNKAYYLNLEYGIATRNLLDEEGGGILAYYTDLPFIAGDGESMEEAINDAKSTFACYLDVALEKGEALKEPSHLMKSKRINITIPLYALEQIDNYTKSHNINRSTFLVESALQRVGLQMYLHEDKQGIIVEHLKKKIPELQSLYLFGSYADGTAISESDIDIAYLSQVPLSAIQRWNMSQQLAILLSCDVDLVELSQTNTIFRYQILSCGNRIYGSGYDVEYFETLAYSFYLRFQEERQPIVDEIMKNKSVFGNRYA